MVKFHPILDRVLLKKVEQPTSSGGIILPSASKDQPEIYTVVAIGSDDSPAGLDLGDTVLLMRNHGTDIELEGQKFIIAECTSILGIIASPYDIYDKGDCNPCDSY